MVLEQHVTGLRAERQRLQAEASKARAVLQELEEQLQRVEVAIEALTGSGKAKPKKASTGVKTHEVVAMVKAALLEGPLRESELCEKVAERLRKSDKTLTGYKLRFEQALKDASFKRDGQAVALVGVAGKQHSQGD